MQKGPGFGLVLTQTTTGGSHPQVAGTILEQCAHFVIPKAAGDFRIMDKTGKGPGFGFEPLQAAA